MDYGRLFTRAWNILWANLYLILLGIVAGLTSSNSTGSTSSYQTSGSEFDQGMEQMPWFREFDVFSGLAVSFIIGMICLGLIIGIIIYVLAQVARGGMIAGVNDIENNRPSNLRTAWSAGWQRKWTLVGIGLVLVIPIVLVVLIFVGLGMATLGTAFLGSTEALASGNLSGFGGLAVGSLAAISVAVCCLLIPFFLFFGLWTELAYRACMIEGMGVFDSFGRGWRILTANLGPVLIIVLSRFGVGIVLLLPLFITSLICCLWPALLLINGAVTAYFSTVWTLAWREWTGLSQPEPPADLVEAV